MRTRKLNLKQKVMGYKLTAHNIKTNERILYYLITDELEDLRQIALSDCALCKNRNMVYIIKDKETDREVYGCVYRNRELKKRYTFQLDNVTFKGKKRIIN